MFKWNETIQKMQGLEEKEKTKYKSFRQQMIACKENGNLIRIDASKLSDFYGCKIGDEFICIKHKIICSSDVCKEERTAESEE